MGQIASTISSTWTGRPRFMTRYLRICPGRWSNQSPSIVISPVATSVRPNARIRSRDGSIQCGFVRRRRSSRRPCRRWSSKRSSCPPRRRAVTQTARRRRVRRNVDTDLGQRPVRRRRQHRDAVTVKRRDAIAAEQRATGRLHRGGAVLDDGEDLLRCLIAGQNPSFAVGDDETEGKLADHIRGRGVPQGPSVLVVTGQTRTSAPSIPNPGLIPRASAAIARRQPGSRCDATGRTPRLVFVFFSNRLGCGGSLLVSAVVTALLLLAFGIIDLG